MKLRFDDRPYQPSLRGGGFGKRVVRFARSGLHAENTGRANPAGRRKGQRADLLRCRDVFAEAPRNRSFVNITSNASANTSLSADH